jgi:hypothetical protein
MIKCDICNKNYSSKTSLYNHNKKFHPIIEYKCIICNKNYASKISLYNHNNKFHPIIEYKCIICNKIYNNYNSKWHHEKTCKLNNLEEKINKIEINNNIQNQNNIQNHTNIQNQTNIQNNIYVKFPNFCYGDLLTKKETLKILNKMRYSIEESIKTIHCNDKYPKHKNIFITNLKSDIAHIFDGNKIISVNKKQVINELIEQHINEIINSITKYKNNISEYVLNILNEMIEDINNTEKEIIDENTEKKYKNYKSFKSDNINKLLYNDCDKKLYNKIKNINLIEDEIDDESEDEIN